MNYMRFLNEAHESAHAMHSAHDPMLVAGSVFVAVLAAYAAMGLADQRRAANPAAKTAWLAIGSLAMGAGVWAMHFSAMLAHALPAPVRYDITVTALSVLPAILAAGVALSVMSAERIGWKHTVFGGTVMGAGIGTMHYTGMAAMRLEGEMLYSLPLVLLSVLVAALLAAMSLHVHFALSSADSKRRAGGWSRPAAALIMGGAVSGMHYTAMAAVHFFPSPGAPAVAHAGLDSAFVANVVMLVAGALTVLLIVATHELEIAGRRIAQAEIQQLNLALESRVEGRTRELASAYGALEARNREITLVGEMASALQTSQDLGEAGSIIGHFCALAFPGSAGAAYLFAPSRTDLEALAAWGEPRPAPSIAPSDCWALRRGRPHHAGDLSRDLRCVHAHSPDASSETLCIPMNAQGNALGLLTIRSALSEDCATRDALRPFAEAVADQLALVLANLQLRETLRDQSIRDPLTGLHNRRFLEESLARELAGARRAQSTFAVLALDADHFKRYNDQFGHDAGDAVLRTLGQVLQSAVRAGDLACRFGGEEFTVVLPNVDAAVAFDWAERFAARLREVEIHHGGKPLPRITMSIGVATYPAHGGDAAVLLQAADAALYEAKRAGRDRVVVAGERLAQVAA